MADFQLDTSGGVSLPLDGGGTRWRSWDGLDAFAQGYVEALLSPSDDRTRTYQVGSVEVHRRPARFSDLAGETLAAILKDCAVAASILGRNHLAEDGAWFWNDGQRQPGFPPLTPEIRDDGRVYLRGAA
jgi:hypothetical protein